MAKKTLEEKARLQILKSNTIDDEILLVKKRMKELLNKKREEKKKRQKLLSIVIYEFLVDNSKLGKILKYNDGEIFTDNEKIEYFKLLLDNFVNEIINANDVFGLKDVDFDTEIVEETEEDFEEEFEKEMENAEEVE